MADLHEDLCNDTTFNIPCLTSSACILREQYVSSPQKSHDPLCYITHGNCVHSRRHLRNGCCSTPPCIRTKYQFTSDIYLCRTCWSNKHSNITYAREQRGWEENLHQVGVCTDLGNSKLEWKKYKQPFASIA